MKLSKIMRSILNENKYDPAILYPELFKIASEQGKESTTLPGTWIIEVVKGRLYNVKIYVEFDSGKITIYSIMRNNNRMHGSAGDMYTVYVGKDEKEAILTLEKSIRQSKLNISYTK